MKIRKFIESRKQLLTNIYIEWRESGYKGKVALVTACLMLFVGFRYCWQVIAGNIEPVLATWVLLCIAVSISLWTYWCSENHSLISNVANFIDVIVAWFILACLLAFGRDIRYGFTAFESSCLAACLLVVVYWRINKQQHEASNLAIQVIMSMAYLPTIVHLWHAESNTEPLEVWVIVWIACIFALIPAIANRNKLAIIYASRAFVVVSILLYLIIRLERGAF